jgi:hypothetical protein
VRCSGLRLFQDDCPPELPVRCAHGFCVRAQSDCPADIRCPADVPVRCGTTLDCVASTDDCPAADDIGVPDGTRDIGACVCFAAAPRRAARPNHSDCIRCFAAPSPPCLRVCQATASSRSSSPPTGSTAPVCVATPAPTAPARCRYRRAPSPALVPRQTTA